jgi:exonuclease VII large subunit
VQNQAGQVIANAQLLNSGENVKLTFAEGQAEATIVQVKN